VILLLKAQRKRNVFKKDLNLDSNGGDRTITGRLFQVIVTSHYTNLLFTYSDDSE